MESYDICVIGGNEMGCGVLRALTLAGFKTVLIEEKDSLLPQCTSSELTFPRSTKETSLIKKADVLNAIACERLNVPCIPLNGTEDSSKYQIDPWILQIAYITQATENGASIKVNCSVVGAKFDGVWIVDLAGQSSFKSILIVDCSIDKAFTDRFALDTAGGISELIEQDVLIFGNKYPDSVSEGNLLLFPDLNDVVAWRSIHGDLVVGGTRPTSELDSTWLKEMVGKTVSTLVGKSALASYSFATQVTPFTHSNEESTLFQAHGPSFIRVASVGSPACLSVAVGDELVETLIGSSEYVWSSTGTTSPPQPISEDQVVWNALPSLEEMCASFAERNDGHVSITTCVGSGVHKVTHPLTRFGFSTRPPFRPISDLRPLAVLIGSIEESSPLGFLKNANVASVLKGGYTNCLYLVKVPNESGDVNQWVVRKGVVGQAGDDPFLRVHRINRTAEHKCVNAAASVGLTPVSYFDNQANLLAQEYISEPETFDAGRVKECLGECVDLLKKLHCSLPWEAFERDPPFSFDVFEITKHYIDVVNGSSPSSDTSWSSLLPSDMSEVLAAGQNIYDALRVHAVKWPPVCCHNDLVVGNMVRGNLGSNQRKLYLIDFEYSACGDRCFDLANLCVNSEFSDEETMRVVERYLIDNDTCSSSTKELFARVQLLKVLSDLREAMWALAHGCMLGPLLDIEPIKPPGDESMPQSFYKDYFERHLERFRRSVGMIEGDGARDVREWIRDATQL